LAAAFGVIMGAGHHAPVFPTQVGGEDLFNSAGGSGGYVDTKAVEHVDGPRSHSTGDDHVCPDITDEAGHHPWPMQIEVWIGDYPGSDHPSAGFLDQHVKGATSEMGADFSA
jgi:hypothetical protein